MEPSPLSDIARILIYTGVGFVLMGALLFLFSKLPALGHLPGEMYGSTSL